MSHIAIAVSTYITVTPHCHTDTAPTGYRHHQWNGCKKPLTECQVSAHLLVIRMTDTDESECVNWERKLWDQQTVRNIWEKV